MLRLSMFWQMFLAFGSLVVFSLGALGVIVGAWVEQQSLRQVEERLRSKAALLQEIARGRTVDELQSRIQALRQKAGAHITLIGKDGRVLVESDDSITDRDEAGPYPDIEAARSATFGVSTRHSVSLQKNVMYVAMRADLPQIEFVRVSLPVTDIQAKAATLQHLVWLSAGAMAILALMVAWALSRRLVGPLQELTISAERIADGAYGHKVYLDRSDEVGQLGTAFNHMSNELATQFAQLDEDRQQLRAVLSGMVEGVIAIDADQNILFANDRAGQMLEFNARAAAGRKLWEIVRQRAVQDVVQATIHRNSDEARKLEFAEPIGKSLTLHVAQLPGHPAHGAVLVFHDTTELRRLERLRQDFVANVSHELKTPLSVITACIETLMEGGGIDDLENRGRFLQQIHEQTQRLHMLILDLLSLARIESGDQQWTMQPLAIAELAEACAERHHARLQAKKQTLLLEPRAIGGEATVIADEEAMAEILDNLVGNAVKYTPEGGTTRLRWWVEDATCCIEVEDTGIGIPAADLPRIFERFYRVDKARSREMGGTGLGLSIVKHLVQAMQGTVRATSELGKGTTFTIRLPLAH
ncbi:MAG TPA: ATP-binding protein [Gemmataceae bacterium]|nr:ATP-binding protein [Gemmataceae bacterium]